MVSVIGNTFKLVKANLTHGTEAGDVVVVCGYERNDDKERMEAALAVFRTEDEAAAAVGGVKALARDPSALAADEKAAHDAAMAKAKKLLKGLSHGSLSSIMGADNWRGVFNVAVPVLVPPDAVPAAVAAERAALEGLRFDAAKLPYRDGYGVTKVGIITEGVVEAIQWGAGESITGNEVVRFTFMVGSEPSEECCTLTDLKHGIAAGKLEVDKQKAAAAKAAAAAAAAVSAMGGSGLPGAGGGSAALTPRMDVLRSAAGPGEFAAFMTDVVPWCTAPGKVEALRKHEALALSEIEGWLQKFGSAASPESLASSVTSPATASDLLMVCGKLEAAGGQGFSREGLKPTQATATAYLQQPPDLSGSEAERRERTALREDGESLKDDLEALKRLAAMANAAPGDADALFKLARDDSSESLQRILLVAADVSKALTGRVAPAVESQIDAVRGALDRRCERAVLTPSELEVASHETLRAIHQIRLARVGKARLLDLIGLPDSSTDADPLGGFASCQRPDSHFRASMARLSLTWQIAWPPHAGMVALFCERLASYVVQSWEGGASWASLSEYYRCLMLKVDAGAKRFALRESHSVFRSAPSIELIDGRYEYVKALEKATSFGREAAMEARLTARIASVASADAAAAAAGSDVERAAAGLKTVKQERKKRQREAKKVRQAAKKAGKTAEAPPVATAATAAAATVATAGLAAAGPGTQSQAETSRAKIEAEVAARVPAISGRKPCPFFFGPQKSCRFSADSCRDGHHGA